MKQLSQKTYQNLTTKQRFRAAVAAIGRGDQDEFERLKNSDCSGRYVINKVSAHTNDLLVFTMVIHLELLECLCKWLLSQMVLDADDDPIGLRGIDEAFEACASIIVARDQFLEDLGIDLETFMLFVGPQSSMMEDLIARSKGCESNERVSEFLEAFRKYFKKGSMA